MQKGLIVNIQKYTQNTINELAKIAVDSGAVAIRTDQPIDVPVSVIGLQKIKNKEFYITTSRKSIIEVGKWSNYIAIDLRKGNNEIELLLAYCHLMNSKVVADISTIEDAKNIIQLCNNQKIIMPEYFATTFNYDKNSYEKAIIINEIKKITDIPIIAEGGYKSYEDIQTSLKAGADYICIGSAISDIGKLTKKYKKIING